VDRLSDAGTGTDLSGDLRYCISQANSSPGDDTITFAVTGTINLTSALPALSTNLAIQGPGPTSLTVLGPSSFRIFFVSRGATVGLSGLTIAGGLASGADGGGIYNAGTLTLSNSILSGNTATLDSSHRIHGDGGGIFNDGTLTLSNSTLSGNTAQVEGGGIFSNYRTTLALSNSTLSDNTADYGGGIFNGFGTLTLSNSTLSGNSVNGSLGDGGGIDNFLGKLTLNNSTLSGNTATNRGGGIFNAGTLTLNNSTLSGNTATSGGGIHNQYYYNTYGIPDFNYAEVTVSNSTISGNTANGSDTAGGISNKNGYVQLLNSTLANNTASSSSNTGSQIWTSPYGAFWLQNSILSGSDSGPNAFAEPGGRMFFSGGHNLSSDGSGNLTGPGDLRNVNPLLGPLQDNGGPTQTMALLAGSPALDAADPAQRGVADQRGVVRSGGVSAWSGRGRPVRALLGGETSPDAFPHSVQCTVTRRRHGFLTLGPLAAGVSGQVQGQTDEALCQR
jgi:hypothetical protein